MLSSDAAGQDDALPRRRQRLQHGDVPEDDLHELRRVAHELDEAERDVAHQPVDRQPHDADQQAEQRRRDDAHRRRPAACSAGRPAAPAHRCRRSSTAIRWNGMSKFGVLGEEAEAERACCRRARFAPSVDDQEPGDRHDDRRASTHCADVGARRRAPDHDALARTLRWISARQRVLQAALRIEVVHAARQAEALRAESTRRRFSP